MQLSHIDSDEVRSVKNVQYRQRYSWYTSTVIFRAINIVEPASTNGYKTIRRALQPTSDTCHVLSCLNDKETFQCVTEKCRCSDHILTI
jgi:predicted aconitase